MASLASSALFRDPAEHRAQRQAALQALAEQDVQPRLVARLEQQGGKLRAVWSADAETPSTLSMSGLEQPEQSLEGEASALGASIDRSEDSATRAIRVQARFEALYQDHTFRQNRRERLTQERRTREETMSKDTQPGGKKGFDQQRFGAEYSVRMRSLRKRQAERDALRQMALAREKDSELDGCTFKPQLVARSPAQREAMQLQKKLSEVAEQLSGSQHPLLASLAGIQREDDAMEKQLRKECEEALAKAQDENRQNVKRFLATDLGRKALQERADAYAEANPGIDDERAGAEAHTDILQSNEEQLKARVLTAFKEKRHMARQRHQIKRLQVVHELIKLEAQYADAVGNKNAKVLIRDFDPSLVAKVKQQPWYIVARATAAQARDRAFSPPPRSP